MSHDFSEENDELNQPNEDEEDDSDGEEECVKRIGLFARKKGDNAKGRSKVRPTKDKGEERHQAKWTPRKVADMVDIVVNNEDFTRKLIFTNTPNATNGRIYEEIINRLKERSAGDQ